MLPGAAADGNNDVARAAPHQSSAFVRGRSIPTLAIPGTAAPASG